MMTETMTQTTKPDTTYNGWKNRQTWNVALWIGNDEGLYLMAVGYVRRRRAMGKAPTWNGFANAYLDGRTPDGIAWNGVRLDRKALNEFLRELVDD
jgi:hypothetical protein